jgi:hypothetical protein
MPLETSLTALAIGLDDGQQHRQDRQGHQSDQRQCRDGDGPAPLPLAYSIPELAAASGFSRAFLYLEVASGRLILRKKGRRSFVLAEDARAWLRDSPPTRHQGAREQIASNRPPQEAPAGAPESRTAISAASGSQPRRGRPPKRKADVVPSTRARATP